MEIGMATTGIRMRETKTGTYKAAAADTKLLITAMGNTKTTRDSIISSMAIMHGLGEAETGQLSLDYSNSKCYSNAVTNAGVGPPERPQWPQMQSVMTGAEKAVRDVELGTLDDATRFTVLRFAVVARAFLPKQTTHDRKVIFGNFSSSRQIMLSNRLTELAVGLRTFYGVAPEAVAAARELFPVVKTKVGIKPKGLCKVDAASTSCTCQKKGEEHQAAIKDIAADLKAINNGMRILLNDMDGAHLKLANLSTDI